MVICLEVPVYIFGEASFIVEVSAIVTENDHEKLTIQERSNPILTSGR